MKVNFNNLRKQTAFAYDRLAKKLNEARQEAAGSTGIVIDAEDIQQDMDDLRSMIVSVCCVYEEGNEDFKDLSGEIGEITDFNPEQ